MNREQILSILYEMALVTAGETRVKPLLNKTIQRLMYHTGFTCGLFIQNTSNGKAKSSEKTNPPANIVASVCSKTILEQFQSRKDLPDWLLEEKAALIDNDAQLEQLCPGDRGYQYVLRLPVPHKGVILLLSQHKPNEDLPFTQIFEPVLNNLSNTINLLELNEQYLDELQSEITEHKNTEIKLIKAKADADKANRAKSDFISSMSHELRTPMNAILGFAQLLQMDNKLSESNKDNTHEILKAGNHLLGLINQVLDLSKIESEQLQVSIEPVEIYPLIIDCLTLLKPVADQRHISLGCNQDEMENLFVSADHLRLKQIIINLISNAIKYNRPSGTVTLFADIKGSKLKLSVQDTGMGIPLDRQDELFQPFNRLGAENMDINGTGIGLVISKKLIEKMDGEIGLESKQGIGSIFWISIPLDSSEHTDLPQELEELTIEQVPKQAMYTILYIEDNPANLKLVTHIFEKQPNIEIISAYTPTLGLDLIMSTKPDLVLLDIQLPEMSGYDVLATLRNNPETKDIPVIAVTANAMPSEIKKGLHAGFNNYLTKPINVSQIIEVVNEHLQAIDKKKSQKIEDKRA